MPVDSQVTAQVASWIAARKAVSVAQNLLREDPANAALQTRLLQATTTAEEAHMALKLAVRSGGLTPARLQEHLRQLAK